MPPTLGCSNEEGGQGAGVHEVVHGLLVEQIQFRRLRVMTWVYRARSLHQG